MNAAFLLVTSAMLVGQGGDKKPVTAPPPVTAAAPAAVSSGSGCGGSSCDPCGCEGFGHRLRDRLRGLFNRDNCDSCQPTTCHTHVRTPVVHNNCDSCQPKIFNWQPRAHTHNACAPATCNDQCGHGHVGIFERLRGRFASNGCCDTGCSGGCGSVTTPTTTTPAKSGEPITTPPKKLPVEKTPDKTPAKVPEKTPLKAPEKAPGQVGAPISPAAPNTISVAPSIPSVELAPIPAPRVEGDRRDPF